MDEFRSFDLNSDHKIRYFPSRRSLPKLLNNVRKWTILNDGIFVQAVQIEHFWSDDIDDLTWSASVTYTGEAV